MKKQNGDFPSKRSVLVLGASGMLGHVLLRYFAASDGISVVGSVRSASVLQHLPPELHGNVVSNVDVDNFDSLTRVLAHVRPDVVINAVGVVKQLAAANDPLASVPINSLLPHRLAGLCEIAGARLVHISTDCVFSGRTGMYREEDESDARDLYGRSKLLGEVDYAHAITLRTSIIGHELNGAHGLIGWFLSQSGSVEGFRRAIFSGLPTVELARVIRDFVIPNSGLRGLYHVSSEPISKFDLLNLVARTYAKSIVIAPNDTVIIDRSLDSSRFRRVTGYAPPVWPELVQSMRDFDPAGAVRGRSG
jgi:dTDP-4-dehydrorhamnose reductase